MGCTTSSLPGAGRSQRVLSDLPLHSHAWLFISTVTPFILHPNDREAGPWHISSPPHSAFMKLPKTLTSRTRPTKKTALLSSSDLLRNCLCTPRAFCFIPNLHASVYICVNITKIAASSFPVLYKHHFCVRPVKLGLKTTFRADFRNGVNWGHFITDNIPKGLKSQYHFNTVFWFSALFSSRTLTRIFAFSTSLFPRYTNTSIQKHTRVFSLEPFSFCSKKKPNGTQEWPQETSTSSNLLLT